MRIGNQLRALQTTPEYAHHSPPALAVSPPSTSQYTRLSGVLSLSPTGQSSSQSRPWRTASTAYAWGVRGRQRG